MTTSEAVKRIDRAQLHGLSPQLVQAIRLLAAQAKR